MKKKSEQNEEKKPLEETNLEPGTEEVTKEVTKEENTEVKNEVTDKLELMRLFEHHIGSAFMIMQQLKVKSPFNELVLAQNSLLKVADLWPNKLMAITLRQTLQAKDKEPIKPEVVAMIEQRQRQRSKAPVYPIKGKTNVPGSELNKHLQGKEEEVVKPSRFKAPPYRTGAVEVKRPAVGGYKEVQQPTAEKTPEKPAPQIKQPLPFSYLQGNDVITLEEIAGSEPEALANLGMVKLKVILLAMHMEQGKSKSKVAIATRLVNRAKEEITKE